MLLVAVWTDSLAFSNKWVRLGAVKGVVTKGLGTEVVVDTHDQQCALQASSDSVYDPCGPVGARSQR